MLSEREQAVEHVLMDYLGGAARVAGRTAGISGPGQAKSGGDREYMQLARRRMAVNRRRMVIFAGLFTLVLLTAVATMVLTAKNYNVLIWVGAGTFNAVNAAIHYAAYQKKKMAFAVLEVLGQDEE